MNKLGIIAAAVASTVALASPVFAEWTEVAKGTEIGVNSGNTYYIDFDTVKENNGYVYYWDLEDLLKPDSDGDLSYKSLNEVDCDIPRKSRILSEIWYAQPMASGSTSGSAKLSDEYNHSSPNSVAEIMTNAACDYAGK